jgi:membrane-associated phospholipid phosphatase
VYVVSFPVSFFSFPNTHSSSSSSSSSPLLSLRPKVITTGKRTILEIYERKEKRTGDGVV